MKLRELLERIEVCTRHDYPGRIRGPEFDWMAEATQRIATLEDRLAGSEKAIAELRRVTWGLNRIG